MSAETEPPVITTYLEMRKAGQLCPKVCDDPHFRIFEAIETEWRYNRFLYELIGSAWAWHDKLSWTDAQWQDYVADHGLRTFVAYYEGSIAGYFELLAQNGEVEIIYFGLAPGFIGRGFGGALLTRALEDAWRVEPSRVWVHTCTNDHPAALENYISRGMKVYKTEKG